MKIPIVKNQIKIYDQSDPISLLQLPKTVEYALEKRNITTVGKFYKSRRKKLYKVKNLGKKSVSYLMKVKRNIQFNKPSVVENEQIRPFVTDPYFTAPSVFKSEKRIQKQTQYSIFEKANLPDNNLGRNDSIDKLNLPTRLYNALMNHGVDTVGKLFDSSREGLYGMRNLGHKSVSYLLEIKKNLETKSEFQQTNNKLSVPAQPEIATLMEPSLPCYIFNGITLDGNDPIVLLGFPTRVENALILGGIDTIKMLYESSPEKLLGLRNLGPKSIEVINEVKNKITLTSQREIIESEAVREKIIQKEEEHIPNEMLIDILLKHCKENKLIEIMSERYGLISGERLTLDEIGKKLGVTRERIRQLQEKALKRIERSALIEKPQIVNLINSSLWNKGGIINAEEADRIIPNLLNDYKYDGSSILDLLSDLEWIDKSFLGDMALYSPLFETTRLSKVISDIVYFVKNRKKLFTIDDILNNIVDLNLEESKKKDFVLKYLKLDPRIEEFETGKYTLNVSDGRIRELRISLISQVLEDEGSPLYFTEIANRLNDLLREKNKYLNERRIYSILIDAPIFANTGARGMYGLTKWGLRKESTQELAAEFIKRSGFPVHIEQIFAYIRKYKDSRKQSVINVLDANEKFIKKGNGFYDLA